MEMEIICISSDDESDSQKENKKNKLVANPTEIGKTSLTEPKVETLSSGDEKPEGNNLKRKISQINEKGKISNNLENKKIKLDIDRDICKIRDNTITEFKLCSTPVPEARPIDKSNIVQSKKIQDLIINKPKLIVKEKKMISYVAFDVFPLFISLCLQKSHYNEKEDMKKIVNKLKRRYEDLDPAYASSESFVSFLNEKRIAIMNDSKKKYIYIEEVMHEMKRKIKQKSCRTLPSEAYDAIPSTSYASNNLSVNNIVESDYDDNETNVNSKTREKITTILCAMRKCDAQIKKLDEEEVEFEDENDSNYIKVEKYKQRMVELYNKLCNLTGENSDAGRVYLRPKHLNTTRIIAVDQAITNFINSKITQKNVKKTGNPTDKLIFPDYRDILECVNRCNEKKNLGLDKRKQEQIAKKAFLELGEHLQRTRRNDYWDTFSLYLENTEDPAIKDANLAKKLADNRNESQKRLSAVFEKYTKKQEEMKDQDDDETLSEEEEEEEEEETESIIDDEDKDNLSVISLSEVDNDNEENVDRTIEESSTPIEKSKINKSMVNVSQNIDKITSSETIANALQEKCIKKVIVKIVKESNVSLSKNEHTAASEKIVADEQCNSNIAAFAENIDKNRKTQGNSCSTVCSTIDSSTININRTEEVLAEVITGDTPKVMSEPVTEMTAKTATDVITKDVAGATPENVIEVLKEKKMEKIITKEDTEKEAEVMTDELIEYTENDKQSEEEKKPLLRVRSFAKPPTTWEDNRHKTNKIAQENAPKVANQIKEVVDLTSEVTTKSSPIRAIQFGNKVIPVIKSQTVIIPPSKNIINVQNVTNNYLKINKRTGQIIAPVRGTTVIRVPSTQTTISQQNQPQTFAIRNEVPLITTGTILQIINHNKPISVTNKPTVQPIPKQTDVRSSISKQTDVRSLATKPK